jgi:hypothetical protein
VAIIPEARTVHIHHCENLKSHDRKLFLGTDAPRTVVKSIVLGVTF